MTSSNYTQQNDLVEVGDKHYRQQLGQETLIDLILVGTMPFSKMAVFLMTLSQNSLDEVGDELSTIDNNFDRKC